MAAKKIRLTGSVRRRLWLHESRVTISAAAYRGYAFTDDHVICLVRLLAPHGIECGGTGLDEVCGLVDAEPDLGEGLFAACAEEDVLADCVDVPEAALQRIATEDGFGAGQPEHPVDGVHASPDRLGRGEEGEGPLLKARLVSPARYAPDPGDGVEEE